MICKNCKHWSRSYSYDYPQDKPLTIGECNKINNNVSYWDSVEVRETKIEDGKIGVENLYTNENFGCIHFEISQ